MVVAQDATGIGGTNFGEVVSRIAHEHRDFVDVPLSAGRPDA
jgi:hypothetical protein